MDTSQDNENEAPSVSVTSDAMDTQSDQVEAEKGEKPTSTASPSADQDIKAETSESTAQPPRQDDDSAAKESASANDSQPVSTESGQGEKAAASGDGPDSGIEESTRAKRGFDLFSSKTLELMAQRGQTPDLSDGMRHEIINQIRINWNNLPAQHRRDFEDLAMKMPAALIEQKKKKTQSSSSSTSTKGPVPFSATKAGKSGSMLSISSFKSAGSSSPRAPPVGTPATGSRAPAAPATQNAAPSTTPRSWASAALPTATPTVPGAQPTSVATASPMMPAFNSSYPPSMMSNSYMMPYWYGSQMPSNNYMMSGWQQPAMAGGQLPKQMPNPNPYMYAQPTAQPAQSSTQSKKTATLPEPGTKYQPNASSVSSMMSASGQIITHYNHQPRKEKSSVKIVVKKSSQTFATVIDKKVTQRSFHSINKRGFADFLKTIETEIPAGTEVEIIRCICKQHIEDGKMIRCDGCKAWQHCLCMQVDESAASTYMCEVCEPRTVPKEVKLSDDVDEDGNTQYKTLVIGDSTFAIGHCVYTESDDPSWNIMRIEKLYKTPDGTRKMYGHHLCRPSEVIGIRRFYKNELFATRYFKEYDLATAKGHCCVMDLGSWRQGRPINFAKKDIFMCEMRYDHKAKRSSQMKWRWGEASSMYEFHFFENPPSEKRNYSAANSVETDEAAPLSPSAADEMFSCPMAGCDRKYASVSGLRKHFHSKHPNTVFSAVTSRTGDFEMSIEEEDDSKPRRTYKKRVVESTSSSTTHRERSRRIAAAAASDSDSEVEDLRPSKSKRRNPYGKFVQDIPPPSRHEFPKVGEETMQITQVLPKQRGFLVRCRFGSKTYAGFCVPQEDSSKNTYQRNRFSSKQRQRTGANEGLNNIRCNVSGCKKTFETQSLLSWHQKLEHDDKPSKKKRKTSFECPACEFSASDANQLASHLTSVHGGGKRQKQPKPKSSPAQTPSQPMPDPSAFRQQQYMAAPPANGQPGWGYPTQQFGQMAMFPANMYAGMMPPGQSAAPR